MKRKEPAPNLSAQIRINIHEEFDVRHWAKQLEVSPDALLAAVEQVGPLVEAVRRYIKDQPQKAEA
jgi:hypothetical protein